VSRGIFSLELTQAELASLHDLLGDANEYNYRRLDLMGDLPGYDPELSDPWADLSYRRMTLSNHFMRRLVALTKQTKEEEI